MKNTHQAASLFALILFFFALSLVNTPKAQAQNLAHWGGVGCAILSEGVRCWGGDRVTNPESLGLRLRAPRSIAIATFKDRTCVIDQSDDGSSEVIKCWSSDKFWTVSSNLGIKNPKKLIGRYDEMCAWDSEGLKCFNAEEPTELRSSEPLPDVTSFSFSGERRCMIKHGRLECVNFYSDDKLTPPRPLVNPKQVIVGSDMIMCVKDDLGDQCWSYRGLDTYDPAGVPGKVKELSSLTVGEHNACGISENKVICWGWSTFDFDRPIVGLVNPREVVFQGSTASALDDNGVTCWGEFNSPSAWTLAVENPTRLIGGGTFICAHTAKGLTCDTINKHDGREDFGPYNLGIGSDRRRQMYDPLTPYLSANGSGGYCAIWSGKLQCNSIYTSNGKRTEMPKNYVTEALAIGGDHLCGIDDFKNNASPKGKVSCFGDNEQKQLEMPKNLGAVSQLAAGFAHTCALTKKGVRCWGRNENGESTPPSGLKDVISIASSGMTSCALQSTQVVCWGLNGSSTPVITGLKNPSRMYLVAGQRNNYFLLCAFDDTGMTCKGSEPDEVNLITSIGKRLRKPLDLAVVYGDEGYVCILNQVTEKKNEIQCLRGIRDRYGIWGSGLGLPLLQLNTDPERKWTQIGGETYSLLNLERSLLKISKEVSPARAWVLKGLAKFLSEKAAPCTLTNDVGLARPECRSRFPDRHGNSALAARYLALQLSGQLILSGTSKRFVEFYGPEYDAALLSTTGRLNASGIDFDHSPRSALEKQVALKVLELSLRAATQMVRLNESQGFMDLLRLVGRSMASPTNPQVQQQIFAMYASQSPALTNLSLIPEASFLVPLMNKAMEALK